MIWVIVQLEQDLLARFPLADSEVQERKESSKSLVRYYLARAELAWSQLNVTIASYMMVQATGAPSTGPPVPHSADLLPAQQTTRSSVLSRLARSRACVLRCTTLHTMSSRTVVRVLSKLPRRRGPRHHQQERRILQMRKLVWNG